MAIAQEKLMELMQAGQAPKGGMGAGGPTPLAPETAGMSDTGAPPMAAPMSTPEPKMGSKEGAMINIQMALDLLEQSLPALGSESDEGQGIMQAISRLTRLFGKREAKTRELIPAEIMQMIQSLPQAGGATPEQRVAATAPVPGTTQPPIAI